MAQDESPSQLIDARIEELDAAAFEDLIREAVALNAGG